MKQPKLYDVTTWGTIMQIDMEHDQPDRVWVKQGIFDLMPVRASRLEYDPVFQLPTFVLETAKKLSEKYSSKVEQKAYMNSAIDFYRLLMSPLDRFSDISSRAENIINKQP